MNEKEKQAFNELDELVDRIEKYMRDTDKRLCELEEKVKSLEGSVTSGT